MYVEKIALQDYRNYQCAELSLSPFLNILLGANAQGKTNVLEAIHLVAAGRSHKRTPDRDLVRWSAETCTLSAEIVKERRRHRIDVRIRGNQREIGHNGVSAQRLSDLQETFGVVMFSPEDLSLAKSGPEVRRDFLDHLLVQLLPRQRLYRLHYYRALRQRNQVLREGSATAEMLEVWEAQLAKFGSRILEGRRSLMGKLDPAARSICERIGKGRKALSLTYRSTLEEADDEQSYARLLTTHRRADIAQGCTMRGPHRDDLLLSLDGKDVRTFASQGEQRTVALALKLAELEVLSGELGYRPVLLLDDVMSELDGERRTILLDVIRRPYQTVVTSTNASYFPEEVLSDAAMFHVKENACSPWSA